MWRMLLRRLFAIPSRLVRYTTRSGTRLMSEQQNAGSERVQALATRDPGAKRTKWQAHAWLFGRYSRDEIWVQFNTANGEKAS